MSKGKNTQTRRSNQFDRIRESEGFVTLIIDGKTIMKDGSLEFVSNEEAFEGDCCYSSNPGHYVRNDDGIVKIPFSRDWKSDLDPIPASEDEIEDHEHYVITLTRKRRFNGERNGI